MTSLAVTRPRTGHASHRPGWRITACAVATGLAAVSLTACAGGGTSTSGSGGATSTFTMAVNSPPLSLDPAKNGGGQNQPYVDVAYQSLIHAGSGGSYSPGLAQSFAYVGTGNKEFKITLRSGLKFSDGTTLDSAAVKTYLDYFSNKAAGPFAAQAADIASVATPDAKTVDIKLSRSNPDMPFLFSESGFLGNVASPKTVTTAPATLGTKTVGAGPYMLDTSGTVQGSVYTYVPNPYYYDKSAVRFKKLVIKVISNMATAYQALQSGQVQFIQGDATLISKAKSAGLDIIDRDAGFYGVFLQDRSGKVSKALGDVRVRQAINYAIDRASLAKAIDGDASKALSQIVASGYQGYDADVEKNYPYDVAKAKKLLADAGYSKGFTFTTTVGSYDTEGTKLAQGVAQQLAAVGITMKIESAKTFADYARQQESAKYPTTTASWSSSTMFSVAGQLVTPTGVVNPFHVKDDAIVKLYDQAAQESSDQAAGTWQQLSQTVSEKAWFAPVMAQRQVFISVKGLEGVSDSLVYPNPIKFTLGS